MSFQVGHTNLRGTFDQDIWVSVLREENDFPDAKAIVSFFENHPLIRQKAPYSDGVILGQAAELFAERTCTLEQIQFDRNFQDELLARNHSLAESRRIMWELVEALIDLATKQDVTLCQEPEEAFEEISQLGKRGFFQVKTIEELTPYLGKVVAYVAKSHFSSPGLQKKIELKYGYIEPELTKFDFAETGYCMAELVPKNSPSSTQVLTESSMTGLCCSYKTLYFKEPKRFSYFCLRQATNKEIAKIHHAVIHGMSKLGSFNMNSKEGKKIIERMYAESQKNRPFFDINNCIMC